MHEQANAKTVPLDLFLLVSNYDASTRPLAVNESSLPSFIEAFFSFSYHFGAAE
jgi:hypothetical protein